MPEKQPWEKSPPELVERFRRTIDRVVVPGTTARPMFGYPCAFVNGNMATGLFADRWFARLPPDAAADLYGTEEPIPFQPMPGRPMRGYVLVPEAVVADDGELDRWIERSLTFTGTLPPKR